MKLNKFTGIPYASVYLFIPLKFIKYKKKSSVFLFLSIHGTKGDEIKTYGEQNEEQEKRKKKLWAEMMKK